MKTDELINVLGANLEVVKGGQLRSTFVIALAVGGIAALCLMLAIFGAPTDAFGGQYLGLKIVAMAFTLGLVVAGTSFLVRAARPGEPGRTPLILAALFFVAMLSAAVVPPLLTQPTPCVALAFPPPCPPSLACIPLFPTPPFASLIWALR